jgi:hypothetical protein
MDVRLFQDFAGGIMPGSRAAAPSAQEMQTATQFTVHNHMVRTLLAAAYGLSPNEILGGPPLVDSDH